MTPDYQFYHGTLLHEIVITADRELRIELQNLHGRADTYVIDGSLGLMIKHSTMRITPWSFTFAKDHVDEMRALKSNTKVSFVGFVCGDDGFVCIRDCDLVSILSLTDKDVASVRVERRPRKMYRISSGGNELQSKIARGVEEILFELKQCNTECAPPSSAK